MVRQERLERSEDDDDHEGSEEDVYSQFRRFRNFFVERGGRGSVNIGFLLRVLQLGLEFRVFVQVEAAFVAGGRCSHQAAKAGGDGYHQHLGNRDIESVGTGDADKGHHGSGDRRACDAHLAGHAGHGARTLRTDAFLQGDVADDRHQRIDNVTCSNEYGQEEGAKRSEEGDSLRMFS